MENSSLTKKILKKRWIRKLRYNFLYFFVCILLWKIKILPRKIGLFIFGLFGRIVFYIPHHEKKITIENLRLIYGDRWSKKEIKKVAKSVYSQIGKNLFDAFYLSRLPFDKFNLLVRHDPIDKVKEAYSQGRGVIIITAHTGCFEMVLHFFHKHGLKGFAIGSRLKDERLDKIVRRLRSGENIFYMDREESPRKVIKYLKEGLVFGVLTDQDTASVEGEFVNFLGKPAYTPSGPIKIGMKFNIPVFVATTVREKGDKHYVFVNGPLDLKNSGNFESDLKENLLLVNNIIGDTIEKYPEQWVWMHRRWRTQHIHTPKSD
ncbi:MAG: hypothetical protein N2053_06100 [Chitinispirillaceae bacterium]|nr:hypothetical protein [Chitinispirillaceae bacterium]